MEWLLQKYTGNVEYYLILWESMQQDEDMHCIKFYSCLTRGNFNRTFHLWPNETFILTLQEKNSFQFRSKFIPHTSVGINYSRNIFTVFHLLGMRVVTNAEKFVRKNEDNYLVGHIFLMSGLSFQACFQLISRCRMAKPNIFWFGSNFNPLQNIVL